MGIILILSNLIVGCTISMVSILGYQYVTDGYGLHPAICVSVITAALILNIIGSGVRITTTRKSH